MAEKPNIDQYGGGGGGGGGAPRPIGVRPDYLAPGLDINTDPFGVQAKLRPGTRPEAQTRGITGDTGNLIERPEPDPRRFTVTTPSREPLYFEGDEQAIPNSVRVETRAEWQRDLAAVGLLKGDFRLGRWEAGSEKAFSQLLGYANATGQTWKSALQDLSASTAVTVDDMGNIVGRGDVDEADRYVRGRYIPGDFQADAYVKPDRASLTQRIKEQFRQVLGRDPREGEIGTYVAELSKADREAYQANVAAAEQEFQSSEIARERAFLQGDTEQERQYVESGGRPDDEAAPAVPEMQQPGEVQGVDPIAQFRERFERDYAGSIARNERIEEAAEGTQSLMQSILGMDAAIGAR